MRAAIPVALSALLVAATIPHAVEDFTFGEFAHRGIPSPVAFVALVVIYAAQVAGCALALRGKSVGLWSLGLAGACWSAGAVAFHGAEIVASGPYRHGLASKGFEVAIVALGAAVAVAAALALVKRRG